jgi:peptidoglycan hydrolase-like protein with peptidoglycan-binding domain
MDCGDVCRHQLKGVESFSHWRKAVAWALNANGIKKLQRALNYACWYQEDRWIPVTGVMDDDTIRSIKEFQRIFDLPQTGTIDSTQLDTIAAEMVRKNITTY